MLDHIQGILWSLVYLLIVFNGLKYRKDRQLLMPVLSACLNFAWEINALVHGKGWYIHILWAMQDVLINGLTVSLIKTRKRKIIYILCLIFMIFLLACVFQMENGMLISVFTIDLIMAADFVKSAKKISLHGKIPIAAFKLLADLTAWLYYLKYSAIVLLIGIAVFLLNLYYFCYCLEERSRIVKLKRKR